MMLYYGGYSVDDGYNVVDEFCCCGKQMVTVRTGNTAHVMSQDEWRKIYGRNHPERWKDGNRVKRNRKIA